MKTNEQLNNACCPACNHEWQVKGDVNKNPCPECGDEVRFKCDKNDTPELDKAVEFCVKAGEKLKAQEYMPKVGEKCKVSYNGNAYIECEIEYVGKIICIASTKDVQEDRYFLVHSKFRPTQTKREKVIESARSAVQGDEFINQQLKNFAHRIIDKLYDAGMLIEGSE